MAGILLKILLSILEQLSYRTPVFHSKVLLSRVVKENNKLKQLFSLSLPEVVV